MQQLDLGTAFAELAPGGARETELGGQSVRTARFQGTGAWHSHATASETVLVWRGRFRVEYRDGAQDLDQGQICVIPPGVEHRGVSEAGADIVLLKPGA